MVCSTPAAGHQAPGTCSAHLPLACPEQNCVCVHDCVCAGASDEEPWVASCWLPVATGTLRQVAAETRGEVLGEARKSAKPC